MLGTDGTRDMTIDALIEALKQVKEGDEDLVVMTGTWNGDGDLTIGIDDERPGDPVMVGEYGYANEAFESSDIRTGVGLAHTKLMGTILVPRSVLSDHAEKHMDTAEQVREAGGEQ